MGGKIMKDFKDKVAVVTGAANGIGLGIVRRFVKEGMKVVLADINATALSKIEEELKASGAPFLSVLTDVSKPEDVEALAKKTIDTYGTVHLLFNNAGVQVPGLILEYTLDDWKWVINVNLWGVINGIRIFVPIMLKQNIECHVAPRVEVARAALAGITDTVTVVIGLVGIVREGAIVATGGKDVLVVIAQQEDVRVAITIPVIGGRNDEVIDGVSVHIESTIDITAEVVTGGGGGDPIERPPAAAAENIDVPFSACPDGVVGKSVAVYLHVEIIPAIARVDIIIHRALYFHGERNILAVK